MVFPKNILKNMIGIVVAMVEIRPLRLKELGKNINWEAEYDEKENAISQSLPCFKLIEIMSLRQQQEDGFYYDP